MSSFDHHIFICCNTRDAGNPRGSCNADGTEAIRNAFKTELKKHQLPGLVRGNMAGCLDQCELGPVIVIYPQGIWYGGVTPADVPRIITETIIAGRVLPDLLISPEMLNNRPAAIAERDRRRAACGPCVAEKTIESGGAAN